MQECLRITRPGGMIRLTETVFGISNSWAYEQLAAMSASALKIAGRSFSPDGRHFGLVTLSGRLLRDAGYQRVQRAAYAIDFSSDTEVHQSMYENFKVTFELAKSFFIKCGLTTEEEVGQLYQQVLKEMCADGFCAVEFYLSTWGVRP
jgi:hypothetical protein